MGSAGTEWDTADVLTKARLNQKNIFVGTGTQINALTAFAGQHAFCTVTGSGFTINNQYVRNTANTSWNRIPPGGSVNTDSIIFSYDETIGNYTTPTGSGASSPLKEIEYLVIGGGGGGGGWIGGGGGAGAYRTASIGVSPKTYTITVGTGGAGGRESYGASLRGGRQGTSSSIIATDFDITSDGGGGGSYIHISESYSGNGSSGGSNSTGAGAYGNNGSPAAGGGQGGSGGGGAGTAGSGINGGAGLSSSITGSSVFRGGGGGGAQDTTTFGSGGSGGGGAGATNTGTAGTANTGGGGGSSTSGSGTDQLGGAGGSGVVIIRFLTGTITATGGTITTSGGYTIHSFTSSGSFVVTATTAGSEAIDDNTATKWTSSSESNPNIYVDMGSSIICSHIAFVTSSTSTAVTIQVQTSTDSITYTTVRTLLNANLVTNGTTYNFIRFNADDARYLRLRCSDATAKILSMNEIKVLTISTITALTNHGHDTIDPSDTSLGSNGF